MLSTESDDEGEIVTGDGTNLIATSVEVLLALHDEAFIHGAYAMVLGRDPDAEGLRHFLARIRNGDSPRAILADIRLSPEGQQRDNVLPGIDRVIRFYRWRRWPLLGTMLRFMGVGNERVDIRRQLAAVETQLHRLACVASLPSGAALRPAEQSNQVAEQPNHTAENPNRTVTHEVTQSSLTWRIMRVAGVSEDVSLTRVEMVRALTELGHDVVPALPSVDADVTALFASPPLLRDTLDRSKLLVGYDWGEGGYPTDWIDDINDCAIGVACASHHTAKVLIDHGVSVPIATIGLGVDHWERIFVSPDYRAPGKRFRFLHVSSCGPSNGIDLLLESFGRVFGSDDDVSLIVKPLGVPPAELLTLLGRLRHSNPDFPDVVLIEDRLTDGDLKALYRQCHAFVAPSRAEGFGLPIAQALLSSLPVVATAWGGHLDYCDETNSWLIDYCFQRARTPNDQIASVWAEPRASSLDENLWKAYRAAPAEHFAKSSSGRKRLLESFTWKDAVLRLASFAKYSKAMVATEPRKARVGWVTTWNVKCGIATHTEQLVASLPTDEFVVFAAIQEPRIRLDEPNCLRVWNPGKDANGLEEIARELAPRSIDTLVIQFNYGFFNHFELNHFIETAIAMGVSVLVDLHSTIDPFGEAENFRLADFLGALRKCHRILAHSPADMDRLKVLGLVNNVMLFPLGVMNQRRERIPPAKQSSPALIASFGYCLPNKGLLELVEAASLLKQEGLDIRLLMLNAEHPAPVSAVEVQRIRNLIGQLGLQNEVEMHSEFLEDEICLALLGNADLVVNPYQSTGESASSSVRYGLVSGRPMAVTPLPIFDDLGDAVFRLPGTTPREMAQGIASALRHLREESETARYVQDAARQWLDEHDYSRQVISLMRTARARPQKVVRGVFINTAKAVCSIYESGRMVYNCIKESGNYTLDYFSLDMLDVPALAVEGRIKPIDGVQCDRPDHLGDYDFWVFNWHFITMAPHLDPESIRRLTGRKFTIVLELEPGNPLKLVPPGIFDGYIALDPAAPATDGIFPFPRPLEGDPRNPDSSSRDVPVIGSFGFGTPGKGFELLIEAVNQEFERAVVRINVPKGTYVSTDVIHCQDYSKYIASLCKKLAKPGIDVRFTHDYLSPEALVNWCADNDLNCFMYTRRQTGLSATTDQAIMSGRPLLTLSNDTFRHIHRYIPPYPATSLRQAIETTVPMVGRMQRDWSRASFCETFQRMLASFGLISYSAADRGASGMQNERRVTIMVASRRGSNPDDIVCYPARVADCLSRTGKYDVLRAYCDDLSELEAHASRHQPFAVIVLDFPGVRREAVAAALKAVSGPKILLAESARPTIPNDGLLVLPRLPLIPYFTSAAGLRTGAPGIWLIGFASHDSNLEEVVAKIKREFPKAELFLEVPDDKRAVFESRVSRLRKRLLLTPREQLPIHALTTAGGEYLIANFTVNHLAIFYNDPERTEELENVSSLAMTTERAVAFTRAAPFPHFQDGGAYVEDSAIADIIGLGMAAQIKLYHRFGEWQLYATIDRLLSNEFARGYAPPLVQVINQ